MEDVKSSLKDQHSERQQLLPDTGVDSDNVELIFVNPQSDFPSHLLLSVDEDPRDSLATHDLLLVPPPKSRYWLIVTHAVGQFSEVTWKFSMSFFLSALTHHESLVWVAVFGLSLGIAVTIGMPFLGSWIDSTPLNRFQIAQRIILMEGFSVALASLSLILLMRSFETSGKAPIIFIVSLNFFGAMAQLADQALLVIVERDWVVEMSLKDGVWLATTNVWMRQIDLTAKVMAPVLAATVALPLLVVHETDHDGITREDWTCAAGVLAVLNILALLLQFVGISVIYKLVPVLAKSRSNHAIKSKVESEGFCNGLKIYLSLPSSGAGVALSVLYLNALTFGNGIMTAHLLHRGMSTEWVGTWRGLAALAGLAGTWIFHISPLSLRWTGLWSILYELICLFVAVLSLLPLENAANGDGKLSNSLLIGGVLASRTGLWVFDLCITQLQQETVPDQARGIVGGVQQSLNSFFGLGSFAIGLISPQNFNLYVLSAFGSVAVAVSFYICSFRSLHVATTST